MAFLELSHISKTFGGVHALREVDLSLEAGEVHCLVGENGSGKSTLIKIISGVQPPEKGGAIAIDGNRFEHLTPGESTRLGIQVIYQDLSLFPNLSFEDELAASYVPSPIQASDGTSVSHDENLSLTITVSEAEELINLVPATKELRAKGKT